MKRHILASILTLCVSHPVFAEEAPLSWWFRPDMIDELPHEVEESNEGLWDELWLRPDGDTSEEPTMFFEQLLGARWAGFNPDRKGRPGKLVLVFAGKRIVELEGDKTRQGTIEDSKVTWSDGTKQLLLNFKSTKKHKARRARRKSSTKINFGKVTLPPLTNRHAELPPWSLERVGEFLQKIPTATNQSFTTRDLSTLAQLTQAHGSLLNFKYSENCKLEDRVKIENALAKVVEPKLTCWMSNNNKGSMKLLGALLQRPIIDCKPREPMTASHCGMATLPYTESFFIQDARINLAMNRCEEELGNTLLHETLHLAGIQDSGDEIDKAVELAESCSTAPASLTFENNSESFVNEMQVETRMLLFRKVRDEAVEKWGWSDGEKAFVLGAICARMEDKYCARRFFQAASDSSLSGIYETPEGAKVSLKALAHFYLFDSITEDIYRMRELARYLKSDPEGVLLKRLETGEHRIHEFFVARTALEAVKNNKGICNGETDERVFCEDLVSLVKTPWFRGR